MTITYTEYAAATAAIAFMYKKLMHADNIEPSKLAQIVDEYYQQYADEYGLEIDDPDVDDIDDDVDETNYNPYMGCDDYDYDPADIGWDI